MRKEIKERIEMIQQREVPEGYKKTKVGIVPEDWDRDYLINLSTDGINNGIFNDPSKVGEGIKLINVINLYEEPYIKTGNLSLLQVNEKELEKHKVLKGDVFFTRSSLKLEGIARCNINIYDEDMVYDCHIMRVRPDQTKIHPWFLKEYCLTSNARKFFMMNAKQTTMTTIGQNDIGKLPVLFPSLKEQRKIVNILFAWDRAIELKEQLIEQKKQLKKGLMQNLLTGKVRLSGFEGEFKKKSLKGHIREIAVRNNKNKVTKVLSVNNTHGFIDQWEQFGKQVASVDTSGYKIVKKGQFAYNPSRVNVGSIDLLQTYEYGILSPMYVVFETDENKLLSRHLYQFFKTHEFYQQMKNLLQGSVRKGLSFKALQDIKLFIPQINEQHQIVKILDNYDKSIQLHEQELELLKQQKKGLMQLLLTGIVRVPEAYDQPVEREEGEVNA